MNMFIFWILMGVAAVLTILALIYFYPETRRDIPFFLMAGANFLLMVANFLVGNSLTGIFCLVVAVGLLFIASRLCKERIHIE